LAIESLEDRTLLATFTVDILTDEADGGSGGNGTSLRDAILQANAAPGLDTIIVPAGTHTLSLAGGTYPGTGDANASLGDLDITESVNIVGADRATTIIDADMIDRIFDIHGTSTVATISVLTVRNGQSTSDGGPTDVENEGGGIHVRTTMLDTSFPMLFLDNVIVEDSTSQDDGGGIYNQGGTVNINNTIVRRNHATGDDGGGIYSAGTNHVLTITNSVIDDNDAADFGGGIRANNSSMPVTITNTAITNNFAPDDGGGLALDSTMATVTNVTISGNESGDKGGGVVLLGSGGPRIFTHVTVTDNTAASGGGFNHRSTGTATIQNSIIFGNTDSAGGTSSDDFVGLADFTSLGHNLTGSGTGFPGGGAGDMTGDSLLGTLMDNGGRSFTHALGALSPAIDAGIAVAPAITTDQRGFEPRDFNGTPDIGAYEFGATAPVTDTTAPTVTSILRQVPMADPTNADSVTFRVTFDEDVQNVGAADFSLSGSASGDGTIGAPSAVSASIYDVGITGLTNSNGIINLNIANGNDIEDLASNALGNSPTIGSEEEYTLDNTAPTVTLPPDVTIEADESTDPTNTGTATATDNVDPNPLVSFADSVVVGACPQASTITRTFTATDATGNSAQGEQTITVVDTAAPVVTVPPDVNAEAPTDVSTATTGDATATDNADPSPTLTSSDVVQSGVGDGSAAGVIERTFTATDACGNQTTGVQTITVTSATFTQIIDDGPGFDGGSFTGPFSGQGFGNDVFFSAANAGNTATWTFTGLTTGAYQVSATWTPHANRATNSPFSIFDGSALRGTVLVNQELAPVVGVTESGTDFQHLGQFNIAGDTLIVKLTDVGTNGYVLADAMRIERLGDIPAASAVTVIDDGDSAYADTGFTEFSVPTFGIASGHEDDVHFSAAGAGNTATWTLFGATPGVYLVSATWSEHANRATNAKFRIFDGSNLRGLVGVDQQSAPLANKIESGTNFQDLGEFAIDGTTLEVKLADDANGYVIADAIRIERTGDLPPPSTGPVTIIDDGDGEFGAPGFTGPFVGQGFQNDVSFSAAGAGNTATWTFSGLTQGSMYRVSATWTEHPNRATNAAYMIDGNAVVVNQELAPISDVVVTGTDFQDLLVSHQAASSTITVTLSDSTANDFVIADAVRIELLPPQLADASARPQHLQSVPVQGTDEVLRMSSVDALYDAAVAHWSLIDPTAAARLANVDVRIADLTGDVLGLASESTRTIWLDTNAAGHGWEVNPQTQFQNRQSIDLLSVLTHELGHVLGRANLDPANYPHEMMTSRLAAGVRRGSASSQLEAILPAADGLFADIGYVNSGERRMSETSLIEESRLIIPGWLTSQPAILDELEFVDEAEFEIDEHGRNAEDKALADWLFADYEEDLEISAL
jgi:hypothetical protein